VAQFEIVRPLRLLDVSKLEEVTVEGNVFDDDYIVRSQKAQFLSALKQRMTMPVMPATESSDYLPTQAIADYLGSQQDPPIDGIIYPSAQVSDKARNVVLFHKASVVKKVPLPEGLRFEVTTTEYYESGPEIEYSVSEEEPTEEERPPKREPSFAEMVAELNREVDHRTTALRLIPGSVHVHHVKRVEVVTELFAVARHRWSRKDWPSRFGGIS
jgi:hypothetical protein